MTTTQGHLGESKVYADLVQQGLYVFCSFLEGAPFDFVVSSPDFQSLNRVQVKSVNSVKDGKCLVTLAGGYLYSGPGKKPIKRSYKPENADILAVYVVSLDKCYYFDSSEIEQKNSMTIDLTSDTLKTSAKSLLKERFHSQYSTQPAHI
jgi:hypothetical protein